MKRVKAMKCGERGNGRGLIVRIGDISGDWLEAFIWRGYGESMRVTLAEIPIRGGYRE